MPITAALIGGGASLLGGVLGGRSAERAARTQADAQVEAARLAAEEARFRPVGITTRFGQSAFQTDEDGRVSGASYTLDPALRAFQDRFMGLAGGGLSQAEMAQQQFAPLGQAGQGLFGLGQQYLAQSPQEAAQQFMAQQQELLAPSREREMAQLQNRLFNTGRGGLSVGATGARPSGAAGLGAASPELEAYYNALAQQDLGLASQAQQAGQQQAAFGAGLLGQGQALSQGQIGFGAGILSQQQAQEAQRLGLGSSFTAQQQALEQGRFGFGADLLARQQAMEQGRASFGAGLFGTGGNLLTQGFQGQTAALGPYQAYLQQMQALEGLGRESLDIGSALGGRIASPTGAQALLQGGMGAAQSNFAANAYNPFATALVGASQNPQFTSALGQLFSSTPSPQVISPNQSFAPGSASARFADFSR